MARTRSLVCLVAVLAVAVTVGVARSHAAEEYVVDFKLSAWKAKHFHDPAKAKQLYDTLKQLGCEAEQFAHGDHTDVRYRCPQWRRITVSDHDRAHEWQRWLRSNGFQTRHEH